MISGGALGNCCAALLTYDSIDVRDSNRSDNFSHWKVFFSKRPREDGAAFIKVLKFERSAVKIANMSVVTRPSTSRL